MADEGYLPPVVASLLLDTKAYIASIEESKAAMTSFAEETTASTAAVGTNAERGGVALGEMGAAGAVGARGVESALDDAESHSSSFASHVSSVFEHVGETMGNWGLPFAAAVSGMGSKIGEAEKEGSGLSTSLESIGKVATGVAAVGLLAVGGESVHLAVDFERAQAVMQNAVKNTGTSFATLNPQIEATYKRAEGLGFNMEEVAKAMTNLTVATKSPTTALHDFMLTANLAREQNIGLSEASEVLVKIYGGSSRALMQLGINLDVGTGKLLTIQKAAEGVTKAQLDLKQVQEQASSVIARASREETAAKEKEGAAQEKVVQAQRQLQSDTEALTASQLRLKEAQLEVRKTAEEEAEAVNKAQRSLSGAKESAREAERHGEDEVREAKMARQRVEDEILEGSLNQYQAPLAQEEAALKEQEAEQNLISAKKKGARELASAREEAYKAEREHASGSVDNQQAMNHLRETEEGVTKASNEVARGQIEVKNASREVTEAQRKEKTAAEELHLADQKVISAQLTLTEEQRNYKRETSALPAVIRALNERLEGSAVAFGKGLPGAMDKTKAALHNVAIKIGQELDPVLKHLGEDLANILNFFNKNRTAAMTFGLVLVGPVAAYIATFIGTSIAGAASALRRLGTDFKTVFGLGAAEAGAAAAAGTAAGGEAASTAAGGEAASTAAGGEAASTAAGEAAAAASSLVAPVFAGYVTLKGLEALTNSIFPEQNVRHFSKIKAETLKHNAEVDKTLEQMRAHGKLPKVSADEREQLGGYMSALGSHAVSHTHTVNHVGKQGGLTIENLHIHAAPGATHEEVIQAMYHKLRPMLK